MIRVFNFIIICPLSPPCPTRCRSFTGFRLTALSAVLHSLSLVHGLSPYENSVSQIRLQAAGLLSAIFARLIAFVDIIPHGGGIFISGQGKFSKYFVNCTAEKKRSGRLFPEHYCLSLQIFFQCFHFIQFFPGQIQIIPSEVSVCRRLFVDRAAQIQHLDDSGRS